MKHLIMGTQLNIREIGRVFIPTGAEKPKIQLSYCSLFFVRSEQDQDHYVIYLPVQKKLWYVAANGV